MTFAPSTPVAMPSRLWRAGSRDILLDRPIVMGILNITPDSFSDGGNFFSPTDALTQAAKMVQQGADIIDVGGESTRPGAHAVSASVEIARVVPAIREIRRRWPALLISIDTVKAEVAEAALEAGADVINDVSAMRLDPAMPALAAKTRCGVVLMHSRGNVSDMASYKHADYGDVVADVIVELESQLLLAEEAGVDRSAVVFDPGFGFSKKGADSMRLLREIPRFASQDVPILVGISRKRFVSEAMRGKGSGELAPGVSPHADLSLAERDAATAALNVLALERGAMIFRVHDVAINRKALDAAWTILTTGAA